MIVSFASTPMKQRTNHSHIPAPVTGYRLQNRSLQGRCGRHRSGDILKMVKLRPKKIENTKAYLIKAVRNNCLNHLSALRRKKEELFSKTIFQRSSDDLRKPNFAHLDLEVELAKALKYCNTKLEPLERAVYLVKRGFRI